LKKSDFWREKRGEKLSFEIQTWQRSLKSF
jgi:hypothetical protein